MEPLIYALPHQPQTSGSREFIKSSNLTVHFDDYPSPKLIKYGFNNIGNQLNMVTLTSVPSYKAGLEFDFDQIGENSFVESAQKNFSIKKFDQTFAEFWEILTLFNLLDHDQTIYSPQYTSTVQDIVDTYQKITKNKFNIKVSGKTDSKTSFNLVIYKYSNVDIDENAAVQFIINVLPNLLTVQSEGSNMILQFFNMQTQITAEIIYLLSNLYTDAYLIKPSIVSDLFDTKYIVLTNLKNKFDLIIPKHPDNVYLSSLGLSNMADIFDTTIQCMNSDVVPKKFKRYNLIKSYLDTKVYEGATYQEMIESQRSNAKKWLETFSNLDNLNNLLDSSLKKTGTKCDNRNQLNSMFT